MQSAHWRRSVPFGNNFHNPFWSILIVFLWKSFDIWVLMKLLCKPYSLTTSAKLMANNSLCSDVSFLVDPEKKVIYGHKMILSLGSPVFHRMFYGSLSEKSNQIIIPDLLVKGFLNTLKHVEGHAERGESYGATRNLLATSAWSPI